MNGQAKVTAQVVDISTLINTGLKGIHAFAGETERGNVENSVLIGSWAEYLKNFGGLSDTNDFPLICKRALEAGCKLRIARIAHYTDVTDASTITGAKATLVFDTTGEFFAKSLGTWGNSIRMIRTAAISGRTGKHDWTIYLNGTSETETIYDVNALLTSADIAKVNASSYLIDLAENMIGKTLAVTAEGVPEVLASGTDTDTVVDADYTGDSAAATGVHILDDATDFTRISVPAKAVPAIDAKLAQYAEARQDCRAILRTPLGISGNTAIDYREGTGVYSHTPINTWYASMVFGGLRITHPTSGLARTIPALADVAGNYSGKDNNAYEWFSAAGAKRGKIKNALAIDYNLGSAARGTEADNVDIHGINAVIDDNDYGLVYWGTSTLQKEDTLLKHENVADLVVFILRAVKPLAKKELFEPNDIQTWKTIHRAVRPLLETIKNRRGIWDYVYQGDQNADSINDIVVNNQADVDAGKYVFIIWIQPTVALKYVGIKITVTNSGTSFEEVQGQPI